MKNLKDELSKKAMPFYIDQNEIKKFHPLNNNFENAIDGIFEAATWLVSERHEKYDLVDLVNALLHKLHTKRY